MTQIMTTKEAAAALGVSPHTLRMHARIPSHGDYRGIVPIKLKNGAWGWPADKVKRVANEGIDAAARAEKNFVIGRNLIKMERAGLTLADALNQDRKNDFLAAGIKPEKLKMLQNYARSRTTEGRGEMSKQSEAKELQGYRTTSRMCANCAHYRSEYAANWYGQETEGKKRCSMGGFAVQKTATCNTHEWGKK